LGLVTPAEKAIPSLLRIPLHTPAGEAAAGCAPARPTAAADTGAEQTAAHAPRERSLDRFLAFQGKLSRLEEQLFADAADGYLDEHSLLDAALIASGVENAKTLRHYQRQLAALVEQLRRCGQRVGPPRQQAEATFDFMHRRILHAGYRLECTDLRMALDHGWFNCVSASVLFNGLVDALGLPVCGLETPGHAKSRLFLSDGPLDVETTCPRWFRLIGDPRQAEHLPQTLEKAPAQDCCRARQDGCRAREVSAVEMVAMIYYNRGVDLLAEKQFAAAAAANAKALRLDPSSATAKGNLLATINNWAIALGTQQHYAEAADLLRQGMAMDPSFETFLLNYVHVYHQWSEGLCADGRFAAALDLLAGAAAEHPDQPYFRRAPAEVHRRWARSLFDTGKPGPTSERALTDPCPQNAGKRLASDIAR
jgi:tetratricopeptide (TPR) repeat protein